MIIASTALAPQQDVYRPHYVSESFFFPPEALTSSYATTHKDFFIPSSSNDEFLLNPIDTLGNHTSKGSRITISTPGRHVNVAHPMLMGNLKWRTSLDYFNTSSIYSKLPFVLASCSFENMTDSEGNTIPELGYMTGSIPSSSINPFIPIREALRVDGSQYYYVDDIGRMNGYGWEHGTSFSTPLAAGISALWLDLNPKLSQLELINVLQSTAYRNAIKENPISNPRYRESVNNFDQWMFGVLLDYPAGLQGYNLGELTGSTNTRRRLFNLHNNSVLAEQNIREHLFSYTTNYSQTNLQGTPNLIAHWPYSQTNRADITGSFANLVFSGSITINNG